jgi:CRP-like cAMP-binding protein
LPRVYFPLNGVVSLMTIMDNGDAIEFATVGNEGMIGLPVFLGSGSMPSQALSQIPGDTLRITAEAFHAETHSGGVLQQMLRHYIQGLLNQIAQSAACNRLHPMTERCARWLLMTHDRVRTNEFPSRTSSSHRCWGCGGRL